MFYKDIRDSNRCIFIGSKHCWFHSKVEVAFGTNIVIHSKQRKNKLSEKKKGPRVRNALSGGLILNSDAVNYIHLNHMYITL